MKTFIRRIRGGLVALAMISAVATPAAILAAAPPASATTVPSTTNYPWAGLTYNNGSDGWGMEYGQCVSYAAWMIYQNHGGTQHPSSIPQQGWMPSDASKSPVTGAWGNAGNWNVAAANAGFAVNGTPTVGAIAQWVTGSDGGQFTVGHVAYVSQVNTNGSIVLTQYNLREDSKFSTLTMPKNSSATDTSNGHGAFVVTWPDHFLHVYDGFTAPTGYAAQVTGTDSSGLAVQSQPHVNHVIRWVGNGTTLYVACQTVRGDQVDGRVYNGHAFTTWDELTDGTYVYDWYMTTPTVGTDGYSPGIPHCSGG